MEGLLNVPSHTGRSNEREQYARKFSAHTSEMNADVRARRMDVSMQISQSGLPCAV